VRSLRQPHPRVGAGALGCGPSGPRGGGGGERPS
jgi:hypothetical protein